MDTVDYFIERCEGALRRDVTKTKGGWLLSFDMQHVGSPVHVSYMSDGQFLVMWPLGNKIHDDFFSEDDRLKLGTFFRSLIK